MTWWGQPLSKGSFQPKQKNRFVVEIGNGGYLLSLSTVDKPKVTIESKSFRMINHNYNYPGVPNWEPITMKFVDGEIWGGGKITPGQEVDSGNTRQTSAVLWEMLLSSGYITPNSYSALKSATDAFGSLRAVQLGGVSPLTLIESPAVGRLAPVVSPEKAATLANAFGAGGESESIFYIRHLKPDGTKIEEWRLYNPIITEISWGDLDYGSDELVEYTLSVTYDWAVLDGES